MLNIYPTNRFKKEYKKMIKQGRNKQDLIEVLNYLRCEQPLPVKYRDHQLTGDYIGYRECHVNPDWLLVYRIEHDKLVIVLYRTGYHADLFD